MVQFVQGYKQRSTDKPTIYIHKKHMRCFVQVDLRVCGLENSWHCGFRTKNAQEQLIKASTLSMGVQGLGFSAKPNSVIPTGNPDQKKTSLIADNPWRKPGEAVNIC